MNQIIKPNVINFEELVKTGETTLSLNVQSKLIELLNEEFTQEEQQWYIANLYVYINYHPIEDHPINLENIYKMLGFANKANAKRTLKNNFIENEDFKIVFIPKDEKPKNDLGGRPEEDIMLNIDTFKNLCMIAKTQKGKEIRKYYVKLENIYNKLIKEEIEEQKQLLLEKDRELQLKDQEFLSQSKLNKHKLLLEKFSCRKCIYLSEIEEDKIKIGSTNDINMRKNNLKDVFGTCLFLDVFECDYYREVEQNILVVLRQHIYKEKINGHSSKEIILLSSSFNYNQLIRVVKEQIENYNKHIERLHVEKSIEYKKLEIELQNKEIEKLEIQHRLEQSIINKAQSGEELLNILKEMNKFKFNNGLNVQEQIHQEVQENEPKVIKQQIAKGRKIQEIDPDNLSVIKKIYNSMIYVLRENEGYEKQSIQSAIKDHKIYKGSRWLFVEHDQNPNVVNNIKPTVKSNQPEQNCILKLNKEKTKIVDSFTGVRQMRTRYKIGDAKVYSIIDNNILFDDNYFVRIMNCPKELLENFEMPCTTSKKAKSVKQTNINTNEETIYKSITDLYIKKGISYKKLASIIKNEEVLLESKWEYVN
jgi:phage anti-repressor protein